MSYIYLASPYAHPDPRVRQERYDDVMRVASIFVLNDEVVYSPALHFHPMALRYSMPKDFKFWGNINLIMLKPAAALVIAKIEGWAASEGLRAEYDFAIEHNIPVFESISIEKYKVQVEGKLAWENGD